MNDATPLTTYLLSNREAQLLPILFDGQQQPPLMQAFAQRGAADADRLAGCIAHVLGGGE